MESGVMLIGIGALIFGAYLFSKLFEQTNIPDVLPLFVIGLVIGPFTGWLAPGTVSEAGDLLATLTLLSVLFVGGLNIEIGTLYRSFSRTFLLMFLNLVATVIIVAGAAYWLFNVPLIAGAIVGILLGGTSSAVVIPIANRLKLTETSRTTLAIESDLNDIFSVTIALALVGVMQQQAVSVSEVSFDILTGVTLSVLLGASVALLWSRVLGRARLLAHNIFTTPALLLIVYGTSELLGLIAPITILVFGITLGNLSSIKRAPGHIFANLTSFHLTNQERSFFSSLVFLFKTFFFVYLGIVMPLDEPRYILWGAGVMIALYIVRIIVAEVTLRGTLPQYDMTMIKSMLPKGLTGGALLVLIGDPLLSNLTYPVILMSIVFTSIAVFVADLVAPAPETSETAPAPSDQDHLSPRLLPPPSEDVAPDTPHYSLRRIPQKP